MKNESSEPYKQLGVSLKRLRQKRQESLAEVSGAVEIDMELLSDIESGTVRPSEDILLLLISYFAIKEDDAVQLLEQAGYERGGSSSEWQDTTQARGKQAPVFALPADIRIAYTDMVHMTVNDFGVVINFMQGGGPSNQPLIVARVGMSQEHARSIYDLLGKTLAAAEPLQLAAGNTDAPKPKRKYTRKKKNTSESDQDAA